MQEKIKIYLPNDIYQIILKDMELFEFYKKDGSLNRNEFLNKLITNYYEIYSLNNEKVLESIKQKLFNSDIDENAVEDMALSILYSLDFNHLELNHKRNNVTISMKPTKDTSFIFDYISDNLLNGTTLSGYLRSLISSYVHIPQDKRERILFKDNYELVDKAIQNNKKIYFVIKRYDKETRHIVSPFAIENSKEELFNYLLADKDSVPMSFRISRIKNLAVLNESASFSSLSLDSFQKMIKNGPQFAYGEKENNPIKIKLTDAGKLKYTRIYLHRPDYREIENNNIYVFDCSYLQATQYFERFGSDAIVLEPQDLRDRFELFYNKARKAYKYTE